MTVRAGFSEEVLALALQLGSSTVFEASGLPCSLDPSIRPIWQGAALAAAAFPVACAPQDNLALHLAVERAPAGSVLVAEASGFNAGYWGEVLTIAAEERGIRGLVIDGSVRDIATLRARRFPVFARGVAMRGTGKARALSLGQTILFGGVPVAAGDLVLADEDGVMILPATEVTRTLEMARARAQKEMEMIEKLRSGATTVELLDLVAWRDKV